MTQEKLPHRKELCLQPGALQFYSVAPLLCCEYSTVVLECQHVFYIFFIFLQFHKKSLIASSFPGDLIQLGKSQSFRKVQGYFVLWHH